MVLFTVHVLRVYKKTDNHVKMVRLLLWATLSQLWVALGYHDTVSILGYVAAWQALGKSYKPRKF